jgi:3-hydroxyisobutyrate dehydrogenase-like beta-hydroxyacid dehydrogenase
MSECVGIVGVGLMGQAFSHHLLQAGFKVRGFDLDERRLAQLGVPMHVGKLWAELQQTAYEQGLAELDSTAFIEVLRGKAGLPRRT